MVLFNYYRVITCNGGKHNYRNPDNSQGGDQRLRGCRAEQPGRCHSLVLSLFVILETSFEDVTQPYNLGKALIVSQKMGLCQDLIDIKICNLEPSLS